MYAQKHSSKFGFLLFTLLCYVAGSALTAESDAARPNIVWIIGDDLSPDLGCYGDKVVRTPHIDRLAGQGALFTKAFSTAPVCSASRTAWITGVFQTTIGGHQHRTRNMKPLPDGIQTLPHYLKTVGYRTINLKGLGANGKRDFNFEGDNLFETQSLDDLRSGQPFFLYANFFEPHRPFAPVENGVNPDDVKLPPHYPDHPVARADWAAYLDAVSVLDDKVGNLLEWLDENSLSKNTVVFFVGDHGRPHLRAKQWLYDSGIRVPLLVRWPGKVQEGIVVDDLVSTIDLAPTTLRLAGVTPPTHMQGRDFLGKDARRREFIFAARDRCDESFDRIRCVRDSRYKYIRNYYPEIPRWQTSRYKDKFYPMLDLMKGLHKEGLLDATQKRFFAPTRPAEELYDVENDPYEANDLAQDPRHEATLTRLRARLDRWEEETADLGRTPEPLEVWSDIMKTRLTKYPDYRPDEWDQRFTPIFEDLKKREFRPRSEVPEGAGTQDAVERLRRLGATVFYESGRVVEVVLNRTPVTDAELDLVAGFRELTDLSLEETSVGDAGMRRLRGLEKLEWLNLYRTRVGDEGLKHLRDAQSLRFLPVGETGVTDAGLLHLQGLRKLRYLGLRGNRITNAGVAHLSGLEGLTSLHLGETRVTDDGVRHLRKLTKVQKLWLHGTAITDAAIPSLGELRQLRELFIYGTRISSEGVAQLKVKLPDCRIEHSRRVRL